MQANVVKCSQRLTRSRAPPQRRDPDFMQANATPTRHPPLDLPEALSEVAHETAEDQGALDGRREERPPSATQTQLPPCPLSAHRERELRSPTRTEGVAQSASTSHSLRPPASTGRGLLPAAITVQIAPSSDPVTHMAPDNCGRPAGELHANRREVLHSRRLVVPWRELAHQITEAHLCMACLPSRS